MKIRKIKKTDLAQRVNWMNEPQVFSMMNYHYPVTLEETIEWFNINSNTTGRVDFVFEDGQGQLTSMAGITNINQDRQSGEIYIFVNPHKLGEGIGEKAILLLCQYGYNNLNLSSLYLFVSNDNFRAKKLYEKIGFVKNQVPTQYIDYCNAHNKEYYECRFSDFLYP